MTEENWSSEANEPAPKKKGLPKWLWFLGCGCLTMILVFAAGGIFLAKTMKTLMDPEVQWPALAEVLPVDEPYPDLAIVGLPAPVFKHMWTLTANDGQSTTIIYVLKEKGGEDAREELLSSELEIDIPLAGGVQEPESCTVMIQGRELDGLRFTSFPKEEAEDLEEDDEEGFMGEFNRALKKAVIRVDVTPEDSKNFVIVEYSILGRLDPITDEEVAEFLAPFHIGPDR